MKARNKITIRLLLFVFCFFTLGYISGIKAQIPAYRYSVQGIFSIPLFLGADAYKQVFSGVMYLRPSFQIHHNKGFYGGITMGYLQTKSGNSRNANIAALTVKHHILSPQLSLGYHFFKGEPYEMMWCFSAGKSLGKFNRSICPDSLNKPPDLLNKFMEYATDVALNLYSDEHVSFGFSFGWHLQMMKSNSQTNCYNKINSFISSDITGKNNQYISIGLGFNYHFLPLKKQPLRDIPSSQSD